MNQMNQIFYTTVQKLLTKKKKMNCTQAKQIPIIGFLASQGKRPVEIRNGQAVYHSPFKEDKIPSLFVDYTKYDIQVWKDFSTGAGGNILDLVMKMYNVDITGALIILQKPELSKTDFSFFSQQEDNSSNIEIKRLQPLQNRALIEYLQSRKITPARAANYVQECYYYAYPGQTKAFFSLAWENIKNGYELHNAYRKKYIAGEGAPTIINGNNEVVNIFESMLDFISILEIKRINKPVSTCIILNSTNNLHYIIDTLEQYQYINLYFDNDPPDNRTGQKAAESIKSRYPKAKDYSKIIYPDHKDLNEFLTNSHKKSTLQ